MDIYKYWEYTLNQDEKMMKNFFDENAIIYWHNTNEKFSVDEFIEINCKYPGKWKGNICRVENLKNKLITVVNVLSEDESISMKAISFIEIKNDKIISIDEYWSEDGEAPKWRKDLKIGRAIK